MTSDWKRQRCRERIDDLADSGADIDALRRQAIEILQATIGFDRWCSLLLDPDTLVISQGIGHHFDGDRRVVAIAPEAEVAPSPARVAGDAGKLVAHAVAREDVAPAPLCAGLVAVATDRTSAHRPRGTRHTSEVMR